MRKKSIISILFIISTVLISCGCFESINDDSFTFTYELKAIINGTGNFSIQFPFPIDQDNKILSKAEDKLELKEGSIDFYLDSNEKGITLFVDGNDDFYLYSKGTTKVNDWTRLSYHDIYCLKTETLNISIQMDYNLDMSASWSHYKYTGYLENGWNTLEYEYEGND